MDTDNVLAAIAFGVGFIQMHQDFKRSDEVDETRKMQYCSIMGVAYGSYTI